MFKKISQLVLASVLLAPSLSSASVPTLALTFDTNVHTINMDSEEESKVQDAERKIKDIIASSEFKTRVLNFKYLGKKQFKDNGGLSNTQIYKKILDGAETLQPAKNNQMDAQVELYLDATNNTVGYTVTNSTKIFMNKKYFNKYTSVGVSGNLMHEWLHKLGFKHAVKYSKSRDSSVPYAIGAIIRDMASRI